MILIICGTDKSGKSSIIKDLTTVFKNKKVVVFKLSQKPIDKSEREKFRVKVAYSELFEQAKRLDKEGFLVIFDRSYPSEMVYSIKRGYDALKEKYWWDFELKLIKELKQKTLLLVYCTAPKEVLIQRFKKEKEEFMKDDEIDLIKERYQEFLDCTFLPYIIVDSTVDRIKNISTIRKQLKRQGEIKNEFIRNYN